MLVTQESEFIVPGCTLEEVRFWKHDKVTQGILHIISNERADYTERMAAGQTLGEDVAQATARVVGVLMGLDFLKELLEAKFTDDPEVVK